MSFPLKNGQRTNEFSKRCYRTSEGKQSCLVKEESQYVHLEHPSKMCDTHTDNHIGGFVYPPRPNLSKCSLALYRSKQNDSKQKVIELFGSAERMMEENFRLLDMKFGRIISTMRMGEMERDALLPILLPHGFEYKFILNPLGSSEDRWNAVLNAMQ